jgi:4-amino-4-deoxy-L-arabinose transferase-like glycosyltransferase
MNGIIFTLIIALAAFLRFYNLANVPVALNQDEAVNGYDAYSLLVTMRDHHGSFLPVMLESFGDWVSPIITYLTIPFVKVFGLTEFSIRLPVACLGVGTVILMYVFTMQVFKSKTLALLSSFLLAIMPWHIHLSRWAIPPSIVSFFLMLLMVACMWSIKDKNMAVYKVILIAACGGILTYSYPTQKILAPAIIFLFGLIYLNRDNLKSTIMMWMTYLLIVIPLYLPSLLDPVKYNARFNTISIFNKGNILSIGKDFVYRYIRYLSPGFNFGYGNFGNSDNWSKLREFNASYQFLSVFFYVGILICIFIVMNQYITINVKHRLDKKLCLFMLSWLFISPLPASLTVQYDHILRMVHGLTATIVFTTFGIALLSIEIVNFRLVHVLLATIIALALHNILIFSKVYFTQYPEWSKPAYQYGIKNLFEYALKNQNKFDKMQFLKKC